jgi:4-hydroxythreonine-4-phosphate dehydrogenase
MILGVTMGDASGIGPEIILKAYRDGAIRHDIVVFGDLSVLEYCERRLDFGVGTLAIRESEEFEPGRLNVIDLTMLGTDQVRPGEISEDSGRAAREYVVRATRSALAGDVAAVVTLPINKEATRLSDPRFVGHTELVAELCGVDDAAMMLYSDRLAVSHVSTHVPLAEAISRVSESRIVRVIELTAETLRRLIDSPRVAVAGLNPHAGEHGLFGQEDAARIAPAVETCKRQGFDVSGPMPPDTVFYQAVVQDKFDAVVCMYHDQGHIPMKLIDFEGAVNLTMGLPIVRTSVDHGTGFDIAYKGKASTQSFLAALDLAAKLANARKP